MSVHRQAARRDICEPAIVKVLEYAGCIVYRISGKGVFDLIVSCPWRVGFTYILECKDAKTGALTPAQTEFLRVWLGHKAVVSTPLEALIEIDTPHDIRIEALAKWDAWQEAEYVKVQKSTARRAKKAGPR